MELPEIGDALRDAGHSVGAGHRAFRAKESLTVRGEHAIRLGDLGRGVVVDGIDRFFVRFELPTKDVFDAVIEPRARPDVALRRHVFWVRAAAVLWVRKFAVRNRLEDDRARGPLVVALAVGAHDSFRARRQG